MLAKHAFCSGFLLLLLLVGAGCAGRSTQASGGSPVAVLDDVGQFIWQDLITDEVSASRRFYGELLGWSFEETTRLGEPYLLVRSGKQLIGGIVRAEREQPDQPISQWLSYVRVDNVNRAIDRIERAGGTVLVDPTMVGSSSIAAVIKDPQGAILGLLQSSEKVADGPKPVGEFFWREYLTPDSEQALSFYSEILGYQSEISEERDSMTYHILRHTKPRAGMIKIKKIPVRPNWLPYVRVEDPVALAGKALDLGGKVLLAPSPGARNSSVAIVTDPGGAAVALQKWPF